MRPLSVKAELRPRDRESDGVRKIIKENVYLPERHLQGGDLSLVVEALSVLEEVLDVLYTALSLSGYEYLLHHVDVHVQAVFVREPSP